MAKERYEDIDVQFIDQVSLIKDKTRVPITRIVLAQDSNHPALLGVNGRIEYTVTKVVPIEDDPEYVEIFIKDIADAKNKYVFIVPLQNLNQSYLTTILLNTPLFALVGDDQDELADMPGPFKINDFKAIVTFPQPDTKEFVKLASIIKKATRAGNNVPFNVSNDILNRVRTEILEIIVGLMYGDRKALIQLYSHINPINLLAKKERVSTYELIDDDKFLVVYRDLIMKLEQDTNPIMLAALVSKTEAAGAYLNDIEAFEDMLIQAGLSDADLSDKALEVNPSKPIKINTQSQQEDILAYLSAPIKSTNMPESMALLSIDFDIELIYNIDWNGPLPDDVDVEKLNKGDLYAAMLTVIAIRLARLNDIYKIRREAQIAPMVTLISSLTMTGEPYAWSIREGVKLLAYDNKSILKELLDVPPKDVSGRGLISGPFGVLIHSIGHGLLEGGLNLNVIKEAFREQPLIFDYIEAIVSVQEGREGDEEIEEIVNSMDPEANCVAMEAIFKMNDYGTAEDLTEQLPEALKTLAELHAGKNTSFAVDSPAWREEMHKYLAGMTI